MQKKILNEKRKGIALIENAKLTLNGYIRYVIAQKNSNPR